VSSAARSLPRRRALPRARLGTSGSAWSSAKPALRGPAGRR